MRSLRLSATVVGAVVAVGLTSTSAHANGRYPSTSQIAPNWFAANQHLVRTTFGVLLTKDGGKSYDWTCEQAMGYGGTQDPGVAVLADGTLLVAAFEGMFSSRDDGCSWTRATDAGIADEYTIDVTADPRRPERALAVTSTGKSPGVFHNVVLETTDSGRSWHELGNALDSSYLAEAIELAGTAPEHLYVSGTAVDEMGDRVTALAASTDGGLTWKTSTIPATKDALAFIAGVDPLDPRRVYLRVRAPRDALYVSADGGKTLSLIREVDGVLAGFALSPTGDYAFGGGDAGFFFGGPGREPTAAGTVKPLCLFWGKGEMLACGRDFVDGFLIGRASGKIDDASFTPVLPTFTAIRARHDRCPVDSSYGRACPATWAQLSRLFPGGFEPDAPPPAAAPASNEPDRSSCAVQHGAATSSLAALAATVVAACVRRRRPKGEETRASARRPLPRSSQR